MVIQVGDLSDLPLIIEDIHFKEIEELVKINIEISRSDWNLQETSWHFKQNKLVEKAEGDTTDFLESIDLYCQYQQNRFFKLHKNEERINNLFLRIFELKDEINPDVALDEITLLQDEINEQLLPQINNKIMRDPESHIIQNYHELQLPFINKEIIAKLLSYSIGCILGRYSLDKEGLILQIKGKEYQIICRRLKER